MKSSRYIGSRTNNQAEYEALIAGLQFAATVGADEVICYLDSQLASKQLNGEYIVRNLELKKLWKRTQELKKTFKKVNFIKVPRTNIRIQEADNLLNKTLDNELL